MDFETEELDIPAATTSNEMPHRVAVQLIRQGALGRAIAESNERDLRARGIKEIDGPKGSITWPTVVKAPANTFVKRR